MSIVIGLSDYWSKKNEAVVAEKEALANILLHQPKFLRQKHALQKRLHQAVVTVLNQGHAGTIY